MVWATDFSSDTYDTATPAGSDDPAEADDRMREIKSSVQVRENVDHYWPLTGTEVSDADSGEHRKVLFHAPIASTPTVAANHGDLRLKDVSSIAELHWTDEGERELQLTSFGNNLANDTSSGLVKYVGDSIPYTGLIAGYTYYDLTFDSVAGTGIWALAAPVTVNNDLTVTSGDFSSSANAYDMAITGNVLVDLRLR